MDYQRTVKGIKKSKLIYNIITLQAIKDFKNSKRISINLTCYSYSWKEIFFLKCKEVKIICMKQTWNTINNVLGREKTNKQTNKQKQKQTKIKTKKNSLHMINLKMIMVMSLLTLKTYQINSMIVFVNIDPKLGSSIQSTGKCYFEYR